MVTVKMTEEKFHRLMSHCQEELHYGRLKYIWQISVSDDDYYELISWLERCENLGFTFAFAVIERYEGYKLLYGFSNFEISKRKALIPLELHFENSDIMYQQFMKWEEESTHFILPISLKLYLEIVKRLSPDEPEFEEYNIME